MFPLCTIREYNNTRYICLRNNLFVWVVGGTLRLTLLLRAWAYKLIYYIMHFCIHYSVITSSSIVRIFPGDGTYTNLHIFICKFPYYQLNPYTVKRSHNFEMSIFVNFFFFCFLLLFTSFITDSMRLPKGVLPRVFPTIFIVVRVSVYRRRCVS